MQIGRVEITEPLVLELRYDLVVCVYSPEKSEVLRIYRTLVERKRLAALASTNEPRGLPLDWLITGISPAEIARGTWQVLTDEFNLAQPPQEVQSKLWKS